MGGNRIPPPPQGKQKPGDKWAAALNRFGPFALHPLVPLPNQWLKANLLARNTLGGLSPNTSFVRKVDDDGDEWMVNNMQ